MPKSKALIAAEAKVEELEQQVADLEDAPEPFLGDWNTCACSTCITSRQHQADTETIDEILVLAAQ